MPGADGLAGMAPGPRHPLLGLRRHETHALCAALGLDPVCDPSNDDPAFVRNRVRHELLPLCAEVAGRDPVPLLARQAGVLRDEVALLDSLAAEALPDPADARARGRAGAAGPLAVRRGPAGVGCRDELGDEPTRRRWPRWSASWPWRAGAARGDRARRAPGGCGGRAAGCRVEPEPAPVVSRR